MHNKFDKPLIVVFGGAGYIGSVLTQQLLEQDFAVRVVDNFCYGNAFAGGTTDPRLEIIDGDIRDTYVVSSAAKGAEAVILLASIVGKRFEDVHRADMRTVNFLASSVVLDAAIEHGVRRFIFASTDNVYGFQSGIMYETGTPEPESLHTRLKLRMEERVLNSKRRGFYPTVLRICSCHGYSPRMRFDLAANKLIRDAACNGEIVIKNGNQWRAFIPVGDAAHAFVICLKSHINLINGELFNVGSTDENLQIKQVAQLIKELLPETNVIVTDDNPDLTDYHLSCAKIEKILDFKPKQSLQENMRELRDMLAEERFADPFSLQYHNN